MGVDLKGAVEKSKFVLSETFSEDSVNSWDNLAVFKRKVLSRLDVFGRFSTSVTKVEKTL